MWEAFRTSSYLMTEIFQIGKEMTTKISQEVKKKKKVSWRLGIWNYCSWFLIMQELNKLNSSWVQ